MGLSLPRLPRFFLSLIMDNSPVSSSKKRDLVVPEANRIRVVPIPPNRMEVVVHTECEQFRYRKRVSQLARQHGRAAP